MKPVAPDIYTPVADVASEVVDGECLVYHPRHARAFYLNPSASVILALCNGARSVDEICDLIRQAYPEAPVSLHDDVVATLGQLEEFGLLVRA